MLGQEYFKYAINNLMQKKSRTFLTILSIFVGISTIFIFISFGMGLQAYVQQLASEGTADKFIVQPQGSGAPGLDQTFALEQSDIDAIDRTLGVDHVTGFYTSSVEVESKREKKFVFVFGYEPTVENVQLLDEIFGGVTVDQGRNLRKSDSGVVVLGNNYRLDDKVFADALGIGDKLEINGEKFSIVGFYEEIGNPSDDSNVYMAERDVLRLLGEDLKFGSAFGRVDNVDNIGVTVERIEKNVRKSRGLEEGKEDFFVQTYEEIIEQFAGVLNIIVGFVILIALISVIVSAVNTANTMITSVLERTKEIGVMKAIGATRSTIRNMFLAESGLVGLIAGFLGVALGAFISWLLGSFLAAIGWSFLAPQFSPALFIGLILFSTIIGVVSGVTVAIKASLLKPVDALRYE